MTTSCQMYPLPQQIAPTTVTQSMRRVTTLRSQWGDPSAPEIFLSFIEIAKNKMYVGDLGPATIVGSASFNMLVIIAVCMVSIPVGEDRRIKDRRASDGRTC